MSISEGDYVLPNRKRIFYWLCSVRTFNIKLDMVISRGSVIELCTKCRELWCLWFFVLVVIRNVTETQVVTPQFRKNVGVFVGIECRDNC